MMLAAALAALSLDAASAAPGSYTLSAGERRCRIVLDAPSRTPEDSLIAPDAVSGLVMAFPDCPAGLDEAALWRVSADTGELVLFDGAGVALLTARRDGTRQWRGETADGAPVQLSAR